MRATIESQKLLIDLNSIDQNIAKLDHQKKNHPQLIKITELIARVPSIEASIVENDSLILEIKKDISKAEIDVENITKRINKDRERLSSSQTGAKDLIQIQHEVGTLGNKLRELEEVEIEFLEKLEDLEHKKNGLIDILKQMTSDIENLNTNIKADFDNANKEISVLVQDRNLITSRLEKSLIDLYEKIRLDHGIGAAFFDKGKCTSCKIQISPAEINKINSMDLAEVIRCENCRCILVRN